MGELLALASAGCFGLTHFVSGVLTRRAPGLTVSLYAQLGGTAVTLVAVPLWPQGTPEASDAAWGALSGVGTGIGVAFLYRAMSRGPLSVVAPISDVGAVAIPVLIGLLFLGERPSWTGLLGVVLALPSIWLVSGGSIGGSVGGQPAGLRDALVSGAGFAAHFLGIARIPLDAGLWPIVESRVVSVVMILPLVLATRTPVRASGAGTPAAVAGAVGSVATVLYWLAAHQQLLTVVTVLAALYPAVPVVLALLFLRERLDFRQVIGVCGVASAIVLISLGPG